ncbi:probable serine incorporator [Dendronephthya gigantea]|uniref:probable serine incorporator n=1 Tax=Dendronephthya gigantea TaxID=151771 RepID=UPI00106DCDEE|nr:probable serine incorporator [Dendronephthya gigantea]
MGCVVGSLACCCGSTAVSCCCSCCPSCRSSVTTRIMYTFFLLIGVIISAILSSDNVAESLKEHLPFHDKICDESGGKCEEIMGYLSVYRIFLGFAIFHVLLMIITLGVKSQKECRAGIQNGYWGIKFLVLFVLCLWSFWVKSHKFAEAWMYIGLVGGLLFIVIQVMLLIDFAHTWNEVWTNNAEETGNKGWLAALGTFVFVFLGFALTGFILAYVFTTSEGCDLNRFIISFNLITCVLMLGVSILPKIQEVQPKSGLLQSSIISLFLSYITLTSVANEPYDLPDASSNSTSTSCDVQSTNFGGSKNTTMIVGLVVTFVMIIYSSLKTSGSADKFSTNTTAPVDLDEEKGKVVNDEEEEVVYSYSFFHFIYLLAALYIMMVMTNWVEPDVSDTENVQGTWGAFWVKIITGWVCVVLYLWTLVAPICMPNRDFSTSFVKA